LIRKEKCEGNKTETQKGKTTEKMH
jgi:hypothetical protein